MNARADEFETALENVPTLIEFEITDDTGTDLGEMSDARPRVRVNLNRTPPWTRGLEADKCRHIRR